MLLQLPKYVFLCILSEWLTEIEICFLDGAATNQKQREIYLDNIQSLISRIPQNEVGFEHLEWFSHRNIRLREITRLKMSLHITSKMKTVKKGWKKYFTSTSGKIAPFQPPEFICDVLRNSHVTNLDLTNSTSLWSELIMDILSLCNSVTKLSLENCCLLADEAIGHISYCCPNLVDLNINDCHLITDAGLLNTIELRGSKLISLKFAGCQRVTDMTLNHIGRRCSNLKLIQIGPSNDDHPLWNRKYLSNFTVDYVVHILKHCKQLETFLGSVDCTSQVDGDDDGILEIISKRSNLKRFDSIIGCDRGVVSGVMLADYLPWNNFSNFTTLELSYFGFQSNNACNFNLRQLILRGIYECNTTIVQSIQKTAQKSPSLEILHIIDCDKDVYPHIITNFTRSCVHLTELLISYPKAPQSDHIFLTLEIYETIAKNCTKLEKIMFYGNTSKDCEINAKFISNYVGYKTIILSQFTFADCMNISLQYASLTELALQNNNKIADEQLRGIFLDCLSLTKIDLSGCIQITYQTITLITRNYARITCFLIRNCAKIHPQLLTSFVSKMKRSLRVLDLSGVIVNTNETQSLFAALRKCENLESIGLCGCFYRESELKELVVNCHKLKHILLPSVVSNASMLNVAQNCVALRVLFIGSATHLTCTAFEMFITECRSLRTLLYKKSGVRMGNDKSGKCHNKCYYDNSCYLFPNFQLPRIVKMA